MLRSILYIYIITFINYCYNVTLYNHKLFLNKPKMVNAPEGSNQVPFLKKVGFKQKKHGETQRKFGLNPKNLEKIQKIWNKSEKFRINLKNSEGFHHAPDQIKF